MTLTAHLNSDTEALQYLVATKSDDMQANDLLFLADADKLVRRGFLVFFIDHGEVERAEVRLV
jgi:hypothetical protein